MSMMTITDYAEHLRSYSNRYKLPELEGDVVLAFAKRCKAQGGVIAKAVKEMRFLDLGSTVVMLDPFGAGEDNYVVPLGPYTCHPTWPMHEPSVERTFINAALPLLDKPILTETFAAPALVEPQHALWANSPVCMIKAGVDYESTLNKKRRYKWRESQGKMDWIVFQRYNKVSMPHIELIEDWLTARWETRDEVAFALMQFLWGVCAAEANMGWIAALYSADAPTPNPEFIASVCAMHPTLDKAQHALYLQGVYNRPESKVTSQDMLYCIVSSLATLNIDIMFDPTFATSPDESQLLVYKRVFVNADMKRPMVAVFQDGPTARAWEIDPPYYNLSERQWIAPERERVLFEGWKV